MTPGPASSTGRPRPGDVMTPESVVAALYDVISGPADEERDWDRFRGLFLPGARLVLGRRPDGGAGAGEEIAIADLDEFVPAASSQYAEDGFWERETAGRIDRFGNVAQAWSTFETRVGSSDAEPAARGINSIQMVREAGRWQIAAIAWDVELPGQRIPREYR